MAWTSSVSTFVSFPQNGPGAGSQAAEFGRDVGLRQSQERRDALVIVLVEVEQHQGFIEIAKTRDEGVELGDALVRRLVGRRELEGRDVERRAVLGPAPFRSAERNRDVEADPVGPGRKA